MKNLITTKKSTWADFFLIVPTICGRKPKINLKSLTLTFALVFGNFWGQVTAQTWDQMGTDINGVDVSDRCGNKVSLSDDGLTIAVASRGGNADDSGYVRIFTWNGSAWSQKGGNIDGEFPNDFSGSSLSLDSTGDNVAIGSRDAGDSGHARVYTWDGANWVQKGSDIDGEAQGDASGESISLSADGNTLAIGAPNNDGGANRSGHTRVYSWNGTAWTQKGDDIDGSNEFDSSGKSVSLSADGNTVAIGAPKLGGGGNGDGYVRVYTWNGTSWAQMGNDLVYSLPFSGYGREVVLTADGNTVAISGPNEDGGNGSYSGYVEVFVWNGTSWAQKGATIIGQVQGREIGTDLSLDDTGNILAIGSRKVNSDEGQTKVYQFSNGNWMQLGNLIPGAEDDEESGISVSMSADGNYLAAGNPGPFTVAGDAKIYALNPPLGIVGNSLGNAVSVYPNPTSGLVAIDLGKTYPNLVLKTVNLLGQTLKKETFKSRQTIETTITGPPGIYFLTIQTNEGIITKRVLKK